MVCGLVLTMKEEWILKKFNTKIKWRHQGGSLCLRQEQQVREVVTSKKIDNEIKEESFGKTEIGGEIVLLDDL